VQESVACPLQRKKLRTNQRAVSRKRVDALRARRVANLVWNLSRVLEDKDPITPISTLDVA